MKKVVIWRQRDDAWFALASIVNLTPGFFCIKAQTPFEILKHVEENNAFLVITGLGTEGNDVFQVLKELKGKSAEIFVISYSNPDRIEMAKKILGPERVFNGSQWEEFYHQIKNFLEKNC